MPSNALSPTRPVSTSGSVAFERSSRGDAWTRGGSGSDLKAENASVFVSLGAAGPTAVGSEVLWGLNDALTAHKHPRTRRCIVISSLQHRSCHLQPGRVWRVLPSASLDLLVSGHLVRVLGDYSSRAPHNSSLGYLSPLFAIGRANCGPRTLSESRTALLSSSCAAIGIGIDAFYHLRSDVRQRCCFARNKIAKNGHERREWRQHQKQSSTCRGCRLPDRTGRLLQQRWMHDRAHLTWAVRAGISFPTSQSARLSSRRSASTPRRSWIATAWCPSLASGLMLSPTQVPRK